MEFSLFSYVRTRIHDRPSHRYLKLGISSASVCRAYLSTCLDSWSPMGHPQGRQQGRPQSLQCGCLAGWRAHELGRSLLAGCTVDREG